MIHYYPLVNIEDKQIFECWMFLLTLLALIQFTWIESPSWGCPYAVPSFRYSGGPSHIFEDSCKMGWMPSQSGVASMPQRSSVRCWSAVKERRFRIKMPTAESSSPTWTSWYVCKSEALAGIRTVPLWPVCWDLALSFSHTPQWHRGVQTPGQQAITHLKFLQNGLF